MGWGSRLRTSLGPGRKRREIAEELRYHAERRATDGSAHNLGDLDRLRDRTQAADVYTWLESCWQDLRHAGRMLRRAPGFTALVLLSLAIGIGANAAIFSLLNAVLLKTLPVPAPAQIFELTQTDGVSKIPLFSYPVLRQLEAVAGRTALGANSAPAPQPLLGASLPVETELVSGGYFATLGLAPRLGRWINLADNRTLGSSPVAVISYGFWQRHFGGNPELLGQAITIHGVALTVVGIAAAGFTGLDPAQPVDLWTPLMMQSALHATGNRWNVDGQDDQPWPPQEGELWLEVFARVAQPAQAGALAAALSPTVAASMKRLQPSHGLAYGAHLAPYGHGGDSLRKTYGAPLRLLMALVGLMLLIAIANVAALLLARMLRRRQEIAIRLAVGISRARLGRQLLTEGMVLALAAGAAAVAVAMTTSRLVVQLAADPFQPDLDWRAWVFLAAVALLTGLVLGLLPAWQAWRHDPAEALKSLGANESGKRRVPLGRALLMAQVAFALLLVASAALFCRSLVAMFHIDLGFDGSHILTARLSLPDAGVPAAQLAVLQQRLLAQLSGLPGVEAAALHQSGLDDFSADTSGISLAGRVDPPGGLRSNEDTVSRNFFSAVDMTLTRGRGFLATDTATSPSVVVVNQAFARRFYPGEDPLGRTFGYDPRATGKFRIVGIVADARVQDPHKPAVPLFYRLLEQSGNPALTVEVRAAGNPAALSSAVRATITGLDPRLRVRSTSTVAHRLGEMLERDRLVAELSGGFAALALALACLGLYGILAYAVAARGPEFGLRMAMGATRGQVMGMVLREAAQTLAAGAALGLALLLLAAGWLQPQLPAASARDPATLAGTFALLILAPLLVALVPAWRAATADPVAALKSAG